MPHVAFAIRGPIERGDLPGLCERVCELLRQAQAQLVLCDVTGVAPDAVTVDALARLQLAALRHGCRVCFCNASAELLELVEFMGLGEVLSGRTYDGATVPDGKTAARGSKTYAALVRAINVGGHNKVSMADLRAIVGAIGGDDVSTYLQSGNVIFTSSGSPAQLTKAIESQILRDLDLVLTVIVRTHAQLARFVARNPFLDSASEQRSLHAAFLAAKPDRSRIAKLDAAYTSPDEFRVAGQDVYLHYPHGYGRSKLTNAYIEKQLGVAGTVRNWNTVTKLAELTRG